MAKSSFSQRTFLAAFSLFSLLAGPAALAKTPAAPSADCASLNECMSKAHQTKSIDQALDLISHGIEAWKEGESKQDLSKATMIRGQVYLEYYNHNQDDRLLDLAERDFQRVTQLSPASYEGFVGLAMVAANRGKFDETENWFTKGFAADPKNPLGYEERAAYYFARKNFSGTVKDLSSALDLLDPKLPRSVASHPAVDPNDAEGANQQLVMIYVMRAQAYMELGKKTEALADLAQACRLGETDACI